MLFCLYYHEIHKCLGGLKDLSLGFLPKNSGSLLGRPNQTSNSEDPQPQPRKLRFFEDEDKVFEKNRGFLRMRAVWNFEVFEVLTSENLKI